MELDVEFVMSKVNMVKYAKYIVCGSFHQVGALLSR